MTDPTSFPVAPWSFSNLKLQYNWIDMSHGLTLHSLNVTTLHSLNVTTITYIGLLLLFHYCKFPPLIPYTSLVFPLYIHCSHLILHNSNIIKQYSLCFPLIPTFSKFFFWRAPKPAALLSTSLNQVTKKLGPRASFMTGHAVTWPEWLQLTGGCCSPDTPASRS